MLAPAPTVLHALAAHAIDRPDALAFGFGDVALTFGELAARASRVAAGLAARGLAHGERCVLLLPTGGDFICALFGVLQAGLVPVALNTTAPPEQIRRRIALVRAALVIGAWDGAATVAELSAGGGAPPRREIDPEDLAFLQITSGTSGAPKAAMIRHRNLVASIAGSTAYLALTREDVFASFVPLYHDLGLVRFVFTPVYLGCPAHLIAPAIGSLAAWLATISRTRATITSAPDFAYRIATRTVPAAGLDLRSLRYAGNGGEPARATTIAAFEARFGLRHAVQPGYGLAEATLIVACGSPGAALVADARGNLACGPPHPGLEVRIAPDTGEILVRGPVVFAGYFDDDEATRGALRDGWLHTGDVGALDADGRVYVLGRERAMVKRSGALVAPREVEEAVDAVPGVKLSAAIGMAFERGEDLVVVAEVEAGSAELRAAIAAAVVRAVGFAPAEIRLVAPRTIPRTHNGKLQHAELRRRLSEDGRLGEVDQARDR